MNNTTPSHNPPVFSPTQDPMGNQILEDWLDDPKVVAMYLAIVYTGLTNSNPKATPAGLGRLQETADAIHRWLTT